MIIFWIVFVLSFLISFITFVVSLSYVEIEIKKLKFNSNHKKNKRFEDYLIYMRFKFLNKITWMKLEYKKTKKHKIFNHKMINKVIDFKDVLRIKYLILLLNRHTKGLIKKISPLCINSHGNRQECQGNRNIPHANAHQHSGNNNHRRCHHPLPC